MLTKCPECNATFRVSTEQLNIAEGLVRCGLCDTVFNGTDYAFEEEESKKLDTDDVSENSEQVDSETILETETDFVGEYDESNRDDDVDDPDVPPVIIDDISAPARKSDYTLQNILWTAGSIALAILLLGQITYWNKVELLPQSWVDNVCSLIGCATSIKNDLSAIKMLNRNIYTHPNVENALMITTTIVNQSEITQPFPKLQVALLDVQGEVVALRRFTPEQYLVNKALLDSAMQPDQPVGARLEVLDPGNKVIAYEFKFY